MGSSESRHLVGRAVAVEANSPQTIAIQNHLFVVAISSGQVVRTRGSELGNGMSDVAFRTVSPIGGLSFFIVIA